MGELEQGTPFEGWAILELMGHRRLAGYVREQDVAGASFVRIDVPRADVENEALATQFYAPAAVYCITPTTEETARRVAVLAHPTPVKQWELPPATTPAGSDRDDDVDVDEDPPW